MASIIKRRKKFSVVYRYIDEQGNERQKWETFATMAEAKKRKLEVEFKQESNEFVAPTTKTVNDLLSEYMSIYGLNTWAISTYESRQALISNYIAPLIGDTLLDDVTPRMMDKFYRELLSVKSVGSKYAKPKNEFVSPHIVREIHKLLRNAFNQAVKWELMSRNPVEHATLPKEEHVPREIWTTDILFKALDACEDDDLLLAMNLAFSCTLRMGELLGLTWDCVDISQTSIDSGQAFIFVNKELQRVRRDALEALGEKGVIRKFPMAIRGMNTLLVLKEPKTKTSVRKIFLPRSVAEMLAGYKKAQDEIKALFGEEYTDYDLVFASTNGRPMEASKITRLFNDLIRKNDLPKVVFHSLRHTSITYKLKLNGGDMKSVQGDSGHAQLKMVADVYSHIIDDDRCLNAQRMEEAFYSGKKDPAGSSSNADSEQAFSTGTAGEAVDKNTDETSADAALLMKLLQKPEMAALLKTLAASL